MSKYLWLFFCIFFMRSGLAGENLRKFSDVAMNQLSATNQSLIRGWESYQEEDEVVVKIYLSDGNTFEFHCEDTTCHKAGQFFSDASLPQDSEITRDWITLGRNASFDKFNKTVSLKSLNFGALKSYKVWVHKDDHGHGSTIDIWTEMTYEKTIVFIMCHGHHGETDLFCHYKKHPEGGFDKEEHEGHNH